MLHCVPRYENTAVVLELSGLSEQCPAPLFELSLDGDWDESAWARLHSFLYYCSSAGNRNPPLPHWRKLSMRGRGLKMSTTLNAVNT